MRREKIKIERGSNFALIWLWHLKLLCVLKFHWGEIKNDRAVLCWSFWFGCQCEHPNIDMLPSANEIFFISSCYWALNVASGHERHLQSCCNSRCHAGDLSCVVHFKSNDHDLILEKEISFFLDIQVAFHVWRFSCALSINALLWHCSQPHVSTLC